METKFIEDFHKIIKDRENTPLTVVINEKKYGLSGQYYVIDDTVLFFLENTDDYNADYCASCKEVENLIYAEAEDDCWNIIGYYPYNSLKDCEFVFCFDENEEWYTVDTWELKYDGDSLYIPTFYCVKKE